MIALRGEADAHPAVQVYQVFGVPDQRYGEELCAWIELRPSMAASEEDVRAFRRDRIAHYRSRATSGSSLKSRLR
jgi:acyl-CoA synthetase (AMP-forming)/AMP-acid ligase II